MADEITLEARITAISDTYDAMVSQRVYQGPQSPFRVMARLENLGESELDSSVINIFKKNMPKELLGKSVKMSDGTVGFIREYDLKDIQYPKVEVGSRIIKTNKDLYCVSMYSA